MRLAAHQPQYLAWLGYYHKIALCDLFVFLDCVQYKKREFQNRNRIRDRGGRTHWLTIPVRSRGRYEQRFLEVEIDNSVDWRRTHREALRHAYSRAPWFDWLWPELEDFYRRPWESLAELNIAQVQLVLARLSIDTPCRRESEMGSRGRSTERLVELCRISGATGYLSGAGGRDYMDLERFRQASLTVDFQHFEHPVYPQGGLPFQAGLCVFDLLFHAGPDSRRVLCGLEDRQIQY